MRGVFVAGAGLVAAHYEKPPCASDEVAGIIGQGQACLPPCSSSNTCPTDVPKGVTASPQCVLENQSTQKMYCGLVCQKDSQCGDAKCQGLGGGGGAGICTYPQSGQDGSTSDFQYLPFTTEANHMAAFADFVEKYGKTYADEQEKAVRYNVFKENRIYMNHEEIDGVTLAINEFSDMSWAEFRMTYVDGGFRPDLAQQWKGAEFLGTHTYSGADLPDSVDWAGEGATTPIKNQGQCGSCWSFSATGSLEGAWEIATGKLVSISEQQLVDCSTSYGDQGCSGGLMDNAFTYMESNAMCTEESYPYQAADGTCDSAATSTCTVAVPEGGVTGFKDVAHDMKSLMEAVSMGPVSVAIEADHPAFQSYSGGVLTQACGTTLDHGVLVVGYGTLEGKDYWKVKNSWGASWGTDGFIFLERGNSPDGDAGECGLLSSPSYPVVSGTRQLVV